MDSLLREQKEALARKRERERAERPVRPLTFSGAILAVVLGNLITGALIAGAYELLHLF
jgi:hypothetical protein